MGPIIRLPPGHSRDPPSVHTYYFFARRVTSLILLAAVALLLLLLLCILNDRIRVETSRQKTPNQACSLSNSTEFGESFLLPNSKKGHFTFQKGAAVTITFGDKIRLPTTWLFSIPRHLLRNGGRSPEHMQLTKTN